MANTFKNAAFSNVSTGSYDTLYTAPTNTRTIVLGLALVNKTASAVTVKVQFSDYNGNEKILETKGLLATCIQHEMDHLVGKVFVEYLSQLKQQRIKKKISKLSRAG